MRFRTVPGKHGSHSLEKSMNFKKCMENQILEFHVITLNRHTLKSDLVWPGPVGLV